MCRHRTVSSVPNLNLFSITIRKIPRGRVTPRLFQHVAYLQQQWQEVKASQEQSVYVPQLELPLLGFGGSFVLPTNPSSTTASSSARLLLVAGGIGVTPFLQFIEALSKGEHRSQDTTAWDVSLLVSTREPDIMLDLIKAAMAAGENNVPNRLSLQVRLFSSMTPSPELDMPGFKVEAIKGRITQDAIDEATRWLNDSSQGPASRHVFLCGPPTFERAATEYLVNAGISAVDIQRESFDY